MTKIPMSEQIAQRILDHFQNDQGGKLLQSVLQDGMRKMVTEMVEAEVTEFLGGRGHYERRDPESETEGYRNGYRDKRFQTGSGTINVPVPRVRNTPEPFKSNILDKLDIMVGPPPLIRVPYPCQKTSTRRVVHCVNKICGSRCP